MTVSPVLEQQRHLGWWCPLGWKHLAEVGSSAPTRGLFLVKILGSLNASHAMERTQDLEREDPRLDLCSATFHLCDSGQNNRDFLSPFRIRRVGWVPLRWRATFAGRVESLFLLTLPPTWLHLEVSQLLGYPRV